MIDTFAGTLWLLFALSLDVLFALARSAFMNTRLAHLKKLDEEGRSGALRAFNVASESHRLILSIRIGQTATRLAAVGLALATYSSLGALSNGSALLVVAGVLVGTGLLIGLLEFTVENLALRNPERWAIFLAPLVVVLVRLLVPVGSILLRLAGWITGAPADRQQSLVTEEEIMTLVDAGEEEGVIEQDEKDMIYSIFQLDNTLAREVMVPRIDIVAFEKNTSLIDVTEALLESGHSRAPVFRDAIDDIMGLIYIKDLLSAWRNGDHEKKIADLLREPYFVPEAKKVDDLLTEMQTKRVHIAIVVDEYGGTAGVVTIEDIVEEIVGEILDEYDFAEEMPYEKLKEGEFVFRGGIDLDDVNQITGANLSKETSDTLGGFIYSQLGKVPAPGEVVDAGGLHLVVEQVTGRRIRKVRANLIKGSMVESDVDGNLKSAEK